MILVRFARAAALLAPLLLTPACGSYTTNKVKDYRLALTDADTAGDASWQAFFQGMVIDFNEHAGAEVLHYEPSAGDANSPIILTKGLKTRDGKDGWGQWLSETKSENVFSKAPGEHPKRTVEYSMRVEFDQDFFATRRTRTDAVSKAEMECLFFHEVGHGLEMVHNETDQRDVMYPIVGADRDFDRFFNAVRQYMADQ